MHTKLLNPTKSPVVNEGHHHVYVMSTRDRSKSKIGRSATGEPCDRVRAMAQTYPDIDLARSVIIEVDSHRIETLLHIAFDPRRIRHPRGGDGSTEWFQGDVVDEVLQFLDTVAERRGTRYRVTRNLDQLIRKQRHRDGGLCIRTPRPSKQERAEQSALELQALRDGLHERALLIASKLAERAFDAVVHFGADRYLCRTVLRASEPECWHSADRFRVTVWGRDLLDLADVALRAGESSGHWRFLQQTAFVPAGPDAGQEYYRIKSSSGDAVGNLLDRVYPSPFLDDEAWMIIEAAIADLPTVVASSDPGQLAFQNTVSGQ